MLEASYECEPQQAVDTRGVYGLGFIGFVGFIGFRVRGLGFAPRVIRSAKCRAFLEENARMLMRAGWRPSTCTYTYTYTYIHILYMYIHMCVCNVV